MLQGHRRPWLLPIFLLMWLGCGAVAGSVVAAGLRSLNGLPTAERAGPAAGQEPSLAATIAAWTTARRWLDGYALPREHEAEAATVIPGAFGLSVVIRANGTILGRGESVPVDGLSLRRAMSHAMGEAWGAGVRSLAESLGERSVGPRLTLELEVVSAPDPLLGRSFAEAAERIRPGLDGLAVRRGDRWALSFVGRQLASNRARNPSATFVALAAELNLPAADLSELRRTDDVALYRVDGIRLVQLVAGGAPTPLVRNDEFVAESAATADSVARLAAAVAHRLVRTVPRERPDRAAVVTPGVASEALNKARRLLRGDYHPAADEYRPIIAPAADQALGVLAMLRLANSSVPAAVPEAPGLAAECRSTAINILEELASNSAPALRHGEGEPLSESRVAATVVLAVLALPPAERTPWLRELLALTIGTVRDSAAQGEAATSEKPRSANSAHLLALEAAALAAAHRDDPQSITAEAAVAAADRAWEAVTPDHAVTLFPWIVWAEQDLATAGIARAQEPLWAVRDLLIQAQDLSEITASPNGELVVPDLRGGIRLTGSGGHLVADPTAQSLRPIAGMAAMLADPALTPDVVVAPLAARQRAAARFLIQLAVRDPLDRLYRRPDAVSGGIRSSLWESDQPVAAQAMAILAALETLRAFDRVGANDGLKVTEPAPTAAAGEP
jgi:hypothetical protein